MKDDFSHPGVCVQVLFAISWASQEIYSILDHEFYHSK
jgi:hypothetical protein